MDHEMDDEDSSPCHQECPPGLCTVMDNMPRTQNVMVL